MSNSIFTTLNAINVNGHVEKKDTGKTQLSYLSWPWAWAEVKQRYPDASYTIERDEHNLPYFASPLGLIVYTSVTIDGLTHMMWLPVMDGANNAMKTEPYEIRGKYGTRQVAAATMFDVNKTIMRCLVKNLAMFGLGLYIYAGEDLPEDADKPATKPAPAAPANVQPTKPATITVVPINPPADPAKKSRVAVVRDTCTRLSISEDQFKLLKKMATWSGVISDAKVSDLTDEAFDALIDFVTRNVELAEQPA